IANLDSLRFWEATYRQVRVKGGVDGRACVYVQMQPAPRRLLARVAERLAKAEGVHQNLHRPSAQRCVHLSAQELGGGSRDEEVRGAGIELPPDERRTTTPDLNLVEVDGAPCLVANGLDLAPGFVEQPPDVLGRHANEPLVV